MQLTKTKAATSRDAFNVMKARGENMDEIRATRKQQILSYMYPESGSLLHLIISGGWLLNESVSRTH